MAAASQSASNGRRAKRERRGGLLGLLRGPKLFSARRAGDHDTLDASDHDAQDRKHVDMTGWHLDLEVGMLRGRSYRRQRIVLTRAVIAVGAPKCQSREEPGDGCRPAAKRRREEFEDVLPLLEIEKVQDLSHDARSEWAWGTDEGLVALHTSLNGCNAGRKYCLQVTVADLKKMNEHVFDDDGNPETTFSARQLTFEAGSGDNIRIHSAQDFIKLVNRLVQEAKDDRFEAEASCRSRLQRSRKWMRDTYNSNFVQVTVAILIVVNFAANAYEAQKNGHLTYPDGSPTPDAQVLELLDTVFTVVFAVELAGNIFANWFWDFVTNGWYMFDFIVVSISLIKPLLPGDAGPMKVFRLLRAFRVLRIFGRIGSIRSIINALTASLIPVLNAFFIMAIVLALYAIIGVTFYDERSPEDFGNLSLAIISMFRIAAGETWIDGIPIANEDSNVDWATGAFVISFVLIVNWTLIQVAVAVLLDNFISETAREKEESQHLASQEMRLKDTMCNVLDPLLRLITREYMDNQHLKIFLEQLFDLLRIRSSEETLSFESLSFGLRQLPVSPRIHFTRFDYEMITEQGRLTDEKGNLDVSAFTAVMHRQVRHYVRRKLQRSVSETEVAQDFSHLASVQLILSEVDNLHLKYDGLDTRLDQMHNLLTDISHTLGNNEKNMDEPADVVDVSAMEGNADVVDVSAVRERSEETSPHPVKTASATPVSERDMSQSLPAASKEGQADAAVEVAKAPSVGCAKLIAPEASPAPVEISAPTSTSVSPPAPGPSPAAMPAWQGVKDQETMSECSQKSVSVRSLTIDSPHFRRLPFIGEWASSNENEVVVRAAVPEATRHSRKSGNLQALTEREYLQYSEMLSEISKEQQQKERAQRAQHDAKLLAERVREEREAGRKRTSGEDGGGVPAERGKGKGDDQGGSSGWGWWGQDPRQATERERAERERQRAKARAEEETLSLPASRAGRAGRVKERGGEREGRWRGGGEVSELGAVIGAEERKRGHENSSRKSWESGQGLGQYV